MHKVPETTALLVLSVVTGILCGLAAVALKLSIHFIQSKLEGFAAGDKWLFLILPGLGMLISLLIVRFLVKDDIGHGVTKVLQAVSKNESKIKRHNCWSSLLTSAATIGFGGSVGAEAPIVYTGAAIGSNLGRYCGMSYRGMTLLLGCGASGAVAGIFNAPLAGVLFTLEILLFNLSMSGLLPLLLSSVSATLVSYLCLGKGTHFTLPPVEFSLHNVPSYLLLGLFCGFCALYFLRTTLAMEDWLRRFKNPFAIWGICAVALGGLIYFFPPLFGEGYDYLESLMHSAKPGILFILAVLVTKVFAMAFTNAGGGVGGTFGPTLFMGGVAGYFLASLLNLLWPGAASTSDFVMVGMAGLMAGVMQAPLTAIFLIAEITGGYALLVPLILTAAVSFGTIRIFEKYSIYTKRIAARGELLTHSSDQAVLTLIRTCDLLETDFIPVRPNDLLKDLVDTVARSERNLFPVVDAKGRFQGIVSLADIRKDMFRTDLYESKHVFNYMQRAPEYVDIDEPMESVMRKFEKTRAWNLPVLGEDKQYIGFLSKSRIFNTYREELKTFSQD